MFYICVIICTMWCLGARVRVQVTKYNVSLFSAPECLLYKSLGAVQALRFWHCKHMDLYFSQLLTKIKDQDWSGNCRGTIFSSQVCYFYTRICSTSQPGSRIPDFSSKMPTVCNSCIWFLCCIVDCGDAVLPLQLFKDYLVHVKSIKILRRQAKSRCTIPVEFFLLII